MSTIKYRVKAYVPSENQIGTNGFYAEAIKNDDITTVNLAKKIFNKTGVQVSMVKAVLECAAAQIVEEILESNRVYLQDSDGNTMVSIYPKVSGSINQAYVTENSGAGKKYPAGTVVSADLLRPEMLTASAAASIGIKFNKLIDLQKTLQKVNSSTSDSSDNSGSTDDNTGGNTGGGGNQGENTEP